VVTLANSGCLLIAAGAAGGAAVGYAYANGRVYETYNANLNDAWAATKTALQELGMPAVKEERKADGGFVESRTADNETVRIYVDALGSKIPAEGLLSRVSVRVATFGDKPFSNRLLDQVGMHLVPAGLAAAPFAPPGSTGIVQTAAPALATPASATNQNPSGQTAPPLLPSEPTPIKK
jgi:hypothetical protein